MQVYLTADAARDLETAHAWLAANSGALAASTWLDGMEQAVSSLGELPERGGYPKELARLGMREYREIFRDYWRISYRVQAGVVYVYCIADGRRDLQTLLEKRLLQA